MKMLKPLFTALAFAALGTLAGCSMVPKPTADLSVTIRSSLEQAGLRDVTATQDREKGVVTLNGHVPLPADKAQAETIARNIVGNQVIANQIEVIPVGDESSTKRIDADLDKGIEDNLDAVLISEKLRHEVKYSVRNHVVTLTGEVVSQADRARAERVALAVMNVQQVVNELQVKGQKATSSSLD